MIPTGRTVSLLLCVVVCVTTTVVHSATPPTAKRLWSLPSTTNSSCAPTVSSVPPVTLNGTTLFANMYPVYPGCPAPDNTISCVDDATGAVLWTTAIGTDVVWSLILAGKHTLIVVVPTTGVLGLSPQSGKLLWNVTAPAVTGSSTPPLQPMLSTDTTTLYVVSLSPYGFSLLAVDLTAHGPAVAATILSGSCPNNAQSSYLVPVNDSDIVFLVCTSVYFNVNTSNPKQRSNAIAKSCFLCNYAPPIVDAVNGFVYFATYNDTVVLDYATGKQVATFTPPLDLDWELWWVFQGFTDAKTGALTHIVAAVTLPNDPMFTLQLFLLAPYTRGNTSLEATTRMIGRWYLLQATPSRLILANTTSGEMTAVDVSTGTFLWTAPAVFEPLNWDWPSLSAMLSGETLYVMLAGGKSGSSVNTLLGINTETGAYLWQYPVLANWAARPLWIANDPDTAVGDVTMFYTVGDGLTAVVGTATGSRKHL